MDSTWPAATVRPAINNNNNQAQANYSRFLSKRINSEKDVALFKRSSAFKNVLSYVNLLADKIKGTGNKVLNRKYEIQDDICKKCSQLIDELSKQCDEIDLTQTKSSGPDRFGYLAYRDWYDGMQATCREFVGKKLLANRHESDQLAEELLCYLTESFGNRVRIDYGTGHELSFIIFTMGLSCVTTSTSTSKTSGDQETAPTNSRLEVNEDTLKLFVDSRGWDLLALFAYKYLRLCRRVQKKFRLEPAGSCGVYNMDDFQYLPFLFGAAQLNGLKYIGTKDFYSHENVDMFKDEFIFFEAVDFILNNKRGPFAEHSYTLWCFADLGSWENISRRIKSKFTDDVLGPFPIVQHLMFGEYILRWVPGGGHGGDV